MKVGLIGCGRIAKLVHLPLLLDLPGAHVVALAEPDGDRRQAALRLAPGAVAYADYRELLDSGLAEAVVITLPNDLHAEAACAALARDHHVYLEKPAAVSAAEARVVVDAWRASNRVGMLGFNYRFHPTILALRRRIREGSVGTLLCTRTVFTIREPERPAWKRTRAVGGGVLLDLGSHHIDLVRFLFEREIEDVQCWIHAVRSEGDTAFLQLRMQENLFVQSFFALGSVEENSMQVYGEEGRLAADWNLSPFVDSVPATHARGRLRRLWGSARPLLHRPPLIDRFASPLYQASYRTALTHFLACVENGRQARPDMVDGLRCLEIIEAAEASNRAGHPVGTVESGS